MRRSSAGIGTLAIACALAVSVLPGCGVLPSPPGALETDFVPQVTATATPEPATSDGFTLEQHLAVRIRVSSCDGWATGSGWVLNSHQVITNRHVAGGGSHIEVTTYDGHDYVVKSSMIAAVPDLAILTLDDVFTEFATLVDETPNVGDPLTIVGYPLGQELTVVSGPYLDTTPDVLGDAGGDVWLINAHIEHGSSGSPVYDKAGNVIGTVYAGDEKWRALAWPASWLQDLLDDPSGWQDNTPKTC